MARPLLEIDPVEVEKLAQLGCRMDEMAAFFNCSEDTLLRRFASQINKGKADLKMSLRRWQIQAAQKGNVAMMIWLGKQMLGQVERTQIDITKIDDDTFMREAERRLKESGDGSVLTETLRIEKANGTE